MTMTLETARNILERGQTGEIGQDEFQRLAAYIDGLSHDERRTLRKGLDISPRNLWFDYERQEWIE